MKGLLMAGALAFAVAGPATSTILLTDDFAYGASAGSLTTVSGGAWVNHSGTVGNMLYQTSTLSLSGYAFGGTGGAATISNTTGSEDANRTFPVQTGDIYVSALVNISAGGTVAGSYFLHLKDTGTVNFRGRVFAQDVGGNLRFGLSNSGTGTFSPTNFLFNTTYLVVLRYNGTTGATGLHVLTTVPASEPVPLLIAVDPTPLATMLALAIRQSSGTSGTPTAVIDGIRVATTWAETVPVELMKFAAE